MKRTAAVLAMTLATCTGATPALPVSPRLVAAFSTATVPTHVRTACYGLGYAGPSTAISIAQQVAWCNIVYQGAYVAEYQAAGAQVIHYAAYMRCASNDSPPTCFTWLAPGGAYTAAAGRTCNGSTISLSTTYGTTYVADPNKTLTASLGAAVIKLTSGWSGFNAIFLDNEANAYGYSTQLCNYSAGSFVLGTNSTNAAVSGALGGMHFYLNALAQGTLPGATLAQVVSVVSPAAVLGAMQEGVYLNHYSSPGLVTGTHWVYAENMEAAIIAAGKSYWAYANSLAPAYSVVPARLYSIASFLLTYDPQLAIYQTSLSTPSGFHVMPEQGLVPESPLVTAKDVNGYSVGGMYVRQFGACYYKGKYFGKCMVAVNPNGTALPIPYASGYGHQMSVSGNGVYDGGTLSLTGYKPTTLAAYSGAILTP